MAFNSTIFAERGRYVCTGIFVPGNHCKEAISSLLIELQEKAGDLYVGSTRILLAVGESLSSIVQF